MNSSPATSPPTARDEILARIRHAHTTAPPSTNDPLTLPPHAHLTALPRSEADQPGPLPTTTALTHAPLSSPVASAGPVLGESAPIPRDYQRTGSHPAGSPELLDLLADRLRDYRAAVHRTTAADLSALLSSIVEGLPDVRTVIVPPGVPTEWLPSATTDHGTLTFDQLDTADAVLTGCAAAAAETGTIVLDASPDQGRRALTLIPDRHICVVRADQVVHNIPELLTRLDPRRPLTFISGPSATSDIELQRVEGVHGPRTLIVVLVS